MAPAMIQLKRAYEPAARSDGYRVLVERLWPRGLRKAEAHIDAWHKDVAPSHELRRWFGHDPSRFAEFRARYRRELRSAAARAALAELAGRAARGVVTLVYAAHDEQHNSAVVLARELVPRRARARTFSARTPATTTGRAPSRQTVRARTKRSRRQRAGATGTLADAARRNGPRANRSRASPQAPAPKRSPTRRARS